jgi:hypothetical protein
MDIHSITTTSQQGIMKLSFRKKSPEQTTKGMEIECAPQQLSSSDGMQLSEESEQSRQGLLQEIRRHQTSNDAFRKDV